MLIAIFLIIFTIGLIIGLIGNTVMCIKEKWFFALIGMDTLLVSIIGISVDTILEIFSKIS